jgi:parallel beta-helix repeat protein
VSAAASGATVIVCPGVYTEDVVISKALNLVGESATVNATGRDNAIQVAASNVSVQGFTATDAIGEGILVGNDVGTPGTVSNVTIRNNTVTGNDQGNPTGLTLPDSGPGSSSYGQCNGGAGDVPGDCGEGLHLVSAVDSTVVGNHVFANTGGILVTDENGPNHGNLIELNTVSDNSYDCGITIAGHNIAAAGGVYDNTVFANQVTDNGVKGQGGGVLMASGVPGGPYGTGGAVYDNNVIGNVLSGNGLAGVTVHSHAPGQDLNGNVVELNIIGTNNVDGDPDFYPSVDPSTTGVIVASVAPLSITVKDNLIANNVFGIWTTAPVTTTGANANLFVHVTTPVFVSP